MANEFYKGFNREQVLTQKQAVQGPNRSQGFENINARLGNVSKAIDSLNAVAQGGLGVVNRAIQDNATQAGIREAQADAGTSKATSEVNPLAWGASAQREAYNKVRSQSLLVDMPQRIEEDVYNRSMKEFNKPIDELSYEQQSGLYQQAQEAFMKSKGIDKNAELFSVANQMALDIQSKHLPRMYDRSVQLGKQKAQSFVGDSAVMIAKSIRDPKATIEAMDANEVDYASAMGINMEDPNASKDVTNRTEQMGKLGGKTELDQAKLEGFLRNISNDPDRNLDLIRMLKTDEFKGRFGYLPEYNKVITQVDRLTSAAQERAKTANAQLEENMFYKTLMSHSFTEPSEVDSFLGSQSFLDDKKKFQLRKEALSFMEKNKTAFDLGAAYDRGDVGQVLSAKKETRDTLFTQKVMPLTDFSFNDRTINEQQAYSIKQWIDKTGDVPATIFETANASTFDPTVLKQQVKNFQTFSGHLGVNNIGKMFTSRQQARLTLVDNLMKTHGDKWVDKMDIIRKFDEDSASDSNFTVIRQVDSMMKEAGIENKIKTWVPEGGSNLLFGSDDLQPSFTFRDVTMANQEYASRDIKQRAYVYSLSGLNIDMATTKAIEDFKGQNQWVNIGNTSSYIPREFGADERSLTEYLNNVTDNASSFNPYTGRKDTSVGPSRPVIDRLMTDNNLDPYDASQRKAFMNKVSVAPSYDYNRTKRLEIMFDDAPTGNYLTIDGYSKWKETSSNIQDEAARKEVREYRNRNLDALTSTGLTDFGMFQDIKRREKLNKLRMETSNKVKESLR